MEIILDYLAGYSSQEFLKEEKGVRKGNQSDVTIKTHPDFAGFEDGVREPRNVGGL